MNRGIALGADRLDGLVVHGDDFTGMDDFNGETGGRVIAIKLGPQLRFAPNQKNANPVVPRGLNRTFDLRLRRPVRAHRVQGYDAWHGEFRLAGFFDVQDFTTLIVTALGAGAVRHLALVTIGALGK
jgi:hypothetical protein